MGTVGRSAGGAEAALVVDPRTREILEALKARAGNSAARAAPGALAAGFLLEPWEREALRRGGGAVSAAADQFAAWLGALLAVRVHAHDLAADQTAWRQGSPGLHGRIAEGGRLLSALQGAIPALDAAKRALEPQVGGARIRHLEQTELQAFRAALDLRDRLRASGAEGPVPLAQFHTAEDRFKVSRAPVARVRAAAVAVVRGTPRPLRIALVVMAVAALGFGGWDLFERVTRPTARAVSGEELKGLSPYLAEGWAPTQPGAPFIGRIGLEWDDLTEERQRAEVEKLAKALARLGTRSAIVYRPHLGIAFQVTGGRVVSPR